MERARFYLNEPGLILKVIKLAEQSQENKPYHKVVFEALIIAASPSPDCKYLTPI